MSNFASRSPTQIFFNFLYAQKSIKNITVDFFPLSLVVSLLASGDIKKNARLTGFILLIRAWRKSFSPSQRRLCSFFYERRRVFEVNSNI
jgi:hypothetical protein